MFCGIGIATSGQRGAISLRGLVSSCSSAAPCRQRREACSLLARRPAAAKRGGRKSCGLSRRAYCMHEMSFVIFVKSNALTTLQALGREPAVTSCHNKEPCLWNAKSPGACGVLTYTCRQHSRLAPSFASLQNGGIPSESVLQPLFERPCNQWPPMDH